MNDLESLGIVTSTLKKAQEFKKNNPSFDSIYLIELNELILEDCIWGKLVE